MNKNPYNKPRTAFSRWSASRISRFLLLVPFTMAVAACGGGGGSGASSTESYSIGGTLTGLAEGRTLTLQLNDGNDLVLDHTANGQPYVFDTLLPSGSDYAVTVTIQPVQHHCSVANAQGTVAAAVANVDVTCVQVPVVAAGDYHSLALTAEGSLLGWGGNGHGELGLGDTDVRPTPAQMISDNDWRSVSAGYRHTMAIKADGTLWAWGANSDAQLGLGYADGNDLTAPVQVGSDADWSAVFAGIYHTLALKTDGTLWAWGFNVAGQLGLGDTNPRYVPTRVGSGSDWYTVAVGRSYSTLALKRDGTLWAWGSNGDGQLGLGDTDERHLPVQVGGDSDWRMVMGGGQHTLALKEDGSLWAWGAGGDGQLGLGGAVDQSSLPLRVGTATDWSAIDAGYGHSVALKANGSLWAWGGNGWGELGLGDTYNFVYMPLQVGNEADWIAVKSGGGHNLTVKSDGSLWSWGYNLGGQLGVGDYDNRYTPVPVVIGID